jgi:hypothetical protein
MQGQTRVERKKRKGREREREREREETNVTSNLLQFSSPGLVLSEQEAESPPV